MYPSPPRIPIRGVFGIESPTHINKTTISVRDAMPLRTRIGIRGELDYSELMVTILCNSKNIIVVKPLLIF